MKQVAVKASQTGAGKKKAESKAAAEKVEVQGVDAALVKAKVVDEYLGKLNLSTRGTITERVERLAMHFEATVPLHLDEQGQKINPNRSRCDCGGVSDARLVRCPFCGDADSDTPQNEDAAVAELKVDPERGRLNGPHALALNGAGAHAPEAPESGPGDAAVAALVKEQVEVVAAASVAMLDASVTLIRGLYVTAVGNVYDLGTELRRCFAQKLYLQRRDPATNAPLYESWTAFVNTELAGVCSVQYSYTLMAVVRQFSREQVLEHGPKKLNLLLRVTDDELRKELEEELPGLSTRALQAKVTEVAGAGATRETGLNGFAGTPATAGATPTRYLTDRHGETKPVTEWAAQFGINPSSLLARVNDKGEHLALDVEAWSGKATVVAEDPLDPGIDEDGLDALPEPPSEKKPVIPAVKPKLSEAVQGPAAEAADSKVMTMTMTVGRVKVPMFARPTKKGMEPKRAKKVIDDPHGEYELPNGAKLKIRWRIDQHGRLETILDFAAPQV